MPLLWAALGALVASLYGQRWGARAVRGSLLASFIPMARDPALAHAYAVSTGMINDPKGMETLNRLLDEVRAEMAAGRISFSVKGFASPPRFGDLTVDLLPPSAVTSGEEETITLPGYEWPIKARPFGVDWSFDPKDIDMSTGEPIVQTADGYWVWGRGCTQPGGGIMPNWGFVRSQSDATGALELAMEPLPKDQAAKAYARQVKIQVRRLLNRPPWGRGIGLTYVRDTRAPAAAPGQYAILVQVQRQKHVAMARAILGGNEVLGVPVIYEAVGDIYAAPASAPTKPPPFGQPEGHIGGSYDWWWFNLGRAGGAPYDPPDAFDEEQENVDRATDAIAQRLGLARGLPPWLQGIALWRDPNGKLGIKVNVQALTQDVLDHLCATLDPTDPPTVLGSPLWVQPVGMLHALPVT